MCKIIPYFQGEWNKIPETKLYQWLLKTKAVQFLYSRYPGEMCRILLAEKNCLIDFEALIQLCEVGSGKKLRLIMMSIS